MGALMSIFGGKKEKSKPAPTPVEQTTPKQEGPAPIAGESSQRRAATAQRAQLISSATGDDTTRGGINIPGG